MAKLSPAQEVLGNSDLMAIVLEHVPRLEITNLRLCNRALHTMASPSLFRTLIISTREDHLRRLKFVAGHAEFSKRVRVVVWETATYGFDGEWMDGRAHYQDNELICSIYYLLSIERTSNPDLETFPDQGARIIEARYRSTSNHENAPSEMTFWSGGEGGDRAFFDPNIIVGHPRIMPPPHLSLYQGMEAFLCERQNLATCSNTKSLARSGCSIKDFTVTPGYNQGQITRLLHELARLEDFYIKVAPSRPVIDFGGAPAYAETTIISLKDVFGDIILQNLRTLCMDSFWDEPEELCEFLLRHQNTLVELSLSDINLGGTLAFHYEGHNNIVFVEERSSNRSPSLVEWTQVAQTCQALVGLEGLARTPPSVNPERNPLSMFDAVESVELGKNGRDNVLWEGGAWEILANMMSREAAGKASALPC
ncbi:uncharacterized protein LTR77_004718 [Saxophila tyrrhenica]|uniref:F-box domain-containing protein n=1 Tax=Saxophila tyrrhenica TaxID=1690608 RepID=A0AAV9PC99_9PEZI|nr:hypothetical protein LTR77_004718 [Saxophila tyrrhenica]